MIAKILVAWAVLMALVVFAARRFAGQDDDQARGQSLISQPGAFAEEDTALLQKAIPDCGRTLAGFVTAGTPEERNQFVHQPIATAGKMARFYAMNPIITVDGSSLKLKSDRVIKLAGGHAISTVWSVADGKTLDAVFLQEDGEWRLDWDQFVRYSDYPWPLFISGSGGDSGEFRLLARQRASTLNGDVGPLSLTLYSPRFGFPSEPGPGSPEIEVTRTSEDGRLLAAAFQNAKKGARPFDGQMANEDPEGMIRVRVRIHRTRNEHGNFHFEVEKVIACHWISSDEPGVTPLTEEEANRSH
ncbi:hypothetical protein KBB96_18520 [Luteolibacter ambystomatis]|uniref:DUF4440 domain-containing protein n=1 Tax=Luteolibacter ambystomatis TaxID=2824561 RepID=A0A975G8Q8_9BACT|nr:hypothetical protein [Luteolibacter ambystomatis]QUE50841.1 hypothetical protein KBB96_18520 [Luteolibacter ambystomatis]